MGEEWDHLLLLEHQRKELVGRWRFLQGEGRSSGVSHLECHQWLHFGGEGQKRHFSPLGWRHRCWGWGCLEVDRLQSLGILILGGRRTQQFRSTVLSLPPQQQMGRSHMLQWRYVFVRSKDLPRWREFYLIIIFGSLPLVSVFIGIKEAHVHFTGSTGVDVLPYMSVIIVTALLCSALVATVYLVVRRRREVNDEKSFKSSFRMFVKPLKR